MTIALSNALAATQTALLAEQFAGGYIRLFNSASPATPDRAEPGTLMGVVTVDGLSGAGLHFTSAGAVLQKADEPWAFKALAAGNVLSFRIVQNGDTGGDDLDALRIDGDIGTPDEPGAMTWESLAVLLGAPYSIDTFLYLIQPIGSST